MTFFIFNVYSLHFLINIFLFINNVVGFFDTTMPSNFAAEPKVTALSSCWSIITLSSFLDSAILVLSDKSDILGYAAKQFWSARRWHCLTRPWIGKFDPFDSAFNKNGSKLGRVQSRLYTILWHKVSRSCKELVEGLHAKPGINLNPG